MKPLVFGALTMLGAILVFGHRGDPVNAIIGGGALMAGFMGSLRYLFTECGVRK